MSKKKKILIISLSGIGNTILGFPFLNYLRKHFPEGRIDCLVLNQEIADISKNNNIADTIIVLPTKFSKILHLILNLRREKYDYSITLFPSNRWEFNVLSFLIGAKYRITHRYKYGRIRTFSFLQNVKVPVEENLHDVEQNINLLKAFGNSIDDVIIKDIICRGQIVLLQKDVKFAEKYLENRNLNDKFLIGIHPGGGGIWNKRWQGLAKRWPKEKFAKLCDKLIELKKAKVLIFGGPEEGMLKNRIRDLSTHRNDIFIINERSLIKVAAIIKKCKLFISNDTGLMQLSVSIGVPTLGIFGPTNYTRTAPYGDKGYYIKSSLPCSPCLQYPFYSTKSKINCNINFKCLQSISVNDVIDKLRKHHLI